MIRYSENEKSRLLSFPLESVLAACGRTTEHKGYMYYSPFRDEVEPSFHIDVRTNRWYDFGTAEGGGIIDLVCRLKGCDKNDVLYVIAQMDSSFVNNEGTCEKQNFPKTSSTQSPSAISIEKVGDEIKRYALVEYGLGERGIPMDILNQYCKEVSYKIGDRRDTTYFAIGFPNNSGGWVLRSARTKICSSSDISTLDRTGKISSEVSSPKALVFEGFFDMLSWRALYGSQSLNCDVCVLNSVSNWKRAVDWLSSHSKVWLCLDNDEAGRRTVSELAQCVKKINGNLDVWDMSASYAQYKDVAEKLEAQPRLCSQSRSHHQSI